MSSPDVDALPDADAVTEQTGARLGDYTFLQKIGIGSTGEVWLAHHASGRFLALKVLRDECFQDPRQIERLRTEGAIMHQLRHPGICWIYEVGEIEGVHFVAMEFVDGLSLYDILYAPEDTWKGVQDREWSSLIAAARDFRIAHPDAPMSGKPSILLPERQVVDLMARVCDAVAAAHERGIPHRDLKPGNILLYQDGRPVVVDFGLAKVNAPGALAGEEAELLGTLEYMAPEQAQDSAAVNERADVYSLGVILYVMLTGRNAFEPSGEIEADLSRLQNEQPPAPRKVNPDLDPGLEAIVLKCLEKNPLLRYSSAAGLRDDLARHARGESLAARRTGRKPSPGTTSSRSWIATAVAALVALASAGVAGWLLVENAALRKQLETAPGEVAESPGTIAGLQNRISEKDGTISRLEARVAELERMNAHAAKDAREEAGAVGPAGGGTAEPADWKTERDALIASNRKLSEEVLALRERFETTAPPKREIAHAPATADHPAGEESLNFDDPPRDDSATPDSLGQDFVESEGSAEPAPIEQESTASAVKPPPADGEELYPALIESLANALQPFGQLVIFPPGTDRYTARRKNYPESAANLLREMDWMADQIATNGPRSPDEFELLIGRELFLMRVPEAYALLREYHAAHPESAARFLKPEPPRLFANFGQLDFFFRLNPPGTGFLPQLRVMRALAEGFKKANGALYTRETAPALLR